MNKEIQSDLESIENCLSLMSLYRDEWKYRDQAFTSTFWRIVYLSLITIFLPDFLRSINFSNQLIVVIPKCIFAFAGIIFCVFGLYIGFAENQRITSLDLAYRNIEKRLPDAYREKMAENKLLKLRINYVLLSVYGVLMAVAIVKMRYEANL